MLSSELKPTEKPMKIQPIRTMITPSALVCGYAALVMLCLSPVSSVAIGPIVPALPSPTPTPSPTPSPTAASTATPVAPALVNYQGRLALAAGGLPENGSYKISVTIYDRSVGGTAIWAQRFDNAQVVDGQFNVVLGAGQAVSDASADISKAFDQPDRYLETSFEGGPAGLVKQTIQPRQQLMSAPYARVSQFAQTALHGVPPGTVVPYAGSGSSAPEGWEFCNGQALDGNNPKYIALWNAIKTTYGGTGQESFLVPDLRGRTAIGAGQGQGLTNRILASKIGAETHTLTIAEMPSHTHGYFDLWQKDERSDDANDRSVAHFEETREDRKTDATGGSQPHNNMQPSLVLNYIIKL